MTTSRDANYNSFFKVIEESLDFELAYQAAKDIENVTFTHQCINIEILQVEWFIASLKDRNLPRKELAQRITAKYNDWRKSFSFMLLDNKPMPDKMLADLLLEKCKN